MHITLPWRRAQLAALVYVAAIATAGVSGLPAGRTRVEALKRAARHQALSTSRDAAAEVNALGTFSLAQRRLNMTGTQTIDQAQLLELGVASGNPDAALQAGRVQCYIDYAASRDDGHKSCLAWFSAGDGCQARSTSSACNTVAISSMLAIAAPGCQIVFFESPNCDASMDTFNGPDPPQPNASKYLSLQLLEGLDEKVKPSGGNWSNKVTSWRCDCR